MDGTIPANRGDMRRTGVQITPAHIEGPAERNAIFPSFGKNVPGNGFAFGVGDKTRADPFVERLAEIRDGTKANNLQATQAVYTKTSNRLPETFLQYAQNGEGF